MFLQEAIIDLTACVKLWLIVISKLWFGKKMQIVRDILWKEVVTKNFMNLVVSDLEFVGKANWRERTLICLIL